MTVTQTVLVNDGGAPARIMNFECATALTAGMAVGIDTAGKAIPMATADEYPAGYALVDCAVGDFASVITGSGVMLYVHIDGGSVDIVTGDALECSTVAGALQKLNTASDDSVPVAIALEGSTDTAANHADVANGGGVELFKVLVK